MGCALFRRLAGAVEPTPAADRLALRLAPSLDQIEDLLAGTAQLDEPTRAVHVGDPVELTGAVLMPALADLVRDGLRITAVSASTQELLAKLLDGQLDLLVSSAQPHEGGLSSEHFGDAELVLVARADWARRAGTPVVVAELPAVLAHAPLLTSVSTAPTTSLLSDYCAQVGAEPIERPADLVLPDLRGVRSAVLAGAGVAVLPHYLCGRDLLCNTLQAVCLPSPPPVYPLYLTRRSDAAPVLAVETVRRRILAQGRSW